MVKSFNFLAPSLHPNTLLDIAFPLAGPSAPDPLVKSLAVKYASDGHDDFQPLGLAKVMSDRGDGTVRLDSACEMDGPAQLAGRQWRGQVIGREDRGSHNGKRGGEGRGGEGSWGGSPR